MLTGSTAADDDAMPPAPLNSLLTGTFRRGTRTGCDHAPLPIGVSIVLIAPTPLPRMKLPTVIREINVFVVVGVAATACQVGVSLAAQRWLGLGPVLASLVGYAASVGVSYLGNSLLHLPPPGAARAAVRAVRDHLADRAGDQSGDGLVGTHALGWPLWLAMVPVVMVVPPRPS